MFIFMYVEQELIVFGNKSEWNLVCEEKKGDGVCL